MHISCRIGAALLAAVVIAPAYAAGDAAAGQAKSAICAACHGVDGKSPNDLWPNLAGQKHGYLVKQMKAFKEGVRSDPMMSPMAAPLSDVDMEDLATYFGSLK